MIIGTSSTVIFAHEFFAWMAAHVFTTQSSFQRFAAFWRFSWFAIVKGWHAAEFAILFAISLAVLDKFKGSRTRLNVVAAVAFCALFAISDEYHQTFVPGRGGTWVDVLIDALGASLAGLIAWHRRPRSSR